MNYSGYIKQIRLCVLTGFLSIVFLAVPHSVFANEIRVDVNTAQTTTNEEIIVDVVLHATDSLNAVEGRLLFPGDRLSFVEIRDGRSSINFWVEKPHLDMPGSISFSGITPGGFSGANKYIFSVVFKAEKIGAAPLTLDGAKVLLNDGLGTEATLSTRNSVISIKEGDTSVVGIPLVDIDMPEIFTPTIEQSETVFDGKYFLVFSTQDKASGISHYEVREGKYGFYRKADSPYVLKDQSLTKTIFVKAIDRAGNERLVTLSPQKQIVWYQQYHLFGILIVVFGVLVLVIKKVWLKYIK